MESLNKVIASILKNYGKNYVVEKVTFDEKTTVYRLKEKKEVKFAPWVKAKIFYEYETNETTHRMNFKNIDKVEEYLKQKYSEPEGFVTDIIDL